MGVSVSGWKLARAVSMQGQLGVVSGTGADTVLARRLQLGDPGESLREAFEAFPIPAISERVWTRYFRQDKQPDAPFHAKPVPTIRMSSALTDLIVLASFVEVYLAKRGHNGIVGINLLEKIQLPTLPALFGAMLAGVDAVLMGAGIPRQIPAALDSLSELKTTSLIVDVAGALANESFSTSFDPRPYVGVSPQRVRRPAFFAIVSSTTLAKALARKCVPPVDGLIVEGPSAGGHNAAPRGNRNLSGTAEPSYGPEDEPDLSEIRSLGLPFWLAGSYGCPSKYRQALSVGAAGIQVGTLFAFCEESGMTPELKQAVLRLSSAGRVRVKTDGLASPTGFPFKVVVLEGTLSEQSTFDSRRRVCDLGYLRQLFRKPEGKIGYRCPSEPIVDYLKKGGRVEDTEGRKCICNALLATAGLAQIRGGIAEPAILTAGEDLTSLSLLLKRGHDTYTAADVLDYILQPPSLRKEPQRN